METKQDYLNKIIATLSQMNAQIDAMSSKAGNPEANTHFRYTEQLTLSAKRDVACQKLKELQDSDGESWRGHKPDVDGAWNDLRTALTRATALFNQDQYSNNR